MKAVTAGTKIPPASPWTTRNTTSWVSDCASPQAALATVNSAMPVKKTHLWPNRSPTRPAGIRARPKARA